MNRKTHNPLDNLGQKIRNLRLSRGITQRELAGSVISRNMLSMIESGNALPSLDTLVYLAEVLSVTPGFFFADEEELMLYAKKDALSSAVTLLHSNDFEKLISVCLPYADKDREMLQYLILSYFSIAKKYLEKYMLTSASSYLNKAADTAEKLTFGGETVIALCNYIAVLSDSVSKDNIPDTLTDADKLKNTPVPASFTAYLSALRFLTEGKAEISSAIAESGMLCDHHSHHIRGAVRMKSENYSEAVEHIELALSATGIGFFSKYRMLSDLEICKKSLGDFEKAYTIQTSRMEMLGMFSK